MICFKSSADVRATVETESPSFMFMILTPIVALPAVEMFSTVVLITTPFAEMTVNSSDGLTTLAAATFPIFLKAWSYHLHRFPYLTT